MSSKYPLASEILVKSTGDVPLDRRSSVRGPGDTSVSIQDQYKPHNALQFSSPIVLLMNRNLSRDERDTIEWAATHSRIMEWTRDKHLKWFVGRTFSDFLVDMDVLILYMNDRACMAWVNSNWTLIHAHTCTFEVGESLTDDAMEQHQQLCRKRVLGIPSSALSLHELFDELSKLDLFMPMPRTCDCCYRWIKWACCMCCSPEPIKSSRQTRLMQKRLSMSLLSAEQT